ncbi:MAG: VOC family protein, partial [Gammaproteobacteria bacterium]|nr:VOC family protein [Gammaproteobacteria bacterium]
LPDQGPFAPGCNTITLAHNTRSKEEVDLVIQKAVDHGAKLVKAAHDTFWGGYSGYFSDLDGYLWEIAYADSWQFNDDGSLKLD